MLHIFYLSVIYYYHSSLSPYRILHILSLLLPLTSYLSCHTSNLIPFTFNYHSFLTLYLMLHIFYLSVIYYYHSSLSPYLILLSFNLFPIIVNLVSLLPYLKLYTFHILLPLISHAISHISCFFIFFIYYHLSSLSPYLILHILYLSRHILDFIPFTFPSRSFITPYLLHIFSL